MRTSGVGINLIKEFETFKGEAYLDPVGIPCIGWGTTKIYGFKVQLGMIINEPVGELLLAGDLLKVEEEVDDLVRYKLSQNQFDALVSFHYNTGGLGASTLLKIINYGDVEVVEDLFTRWNKGRINGKLVALGGLTRRRKAEYALYAKD